MYFCSHPYLCFKLNQQRLSLDTTFMKKVSCKAGGVPITDRIFFVLLSARQLGSLQDRGDLFMLHCREDG